jgi:hypothetical protein
MSAEPQPKGLTADDFKTGLGEVAATFLGPGHWTPDALAIAECWDRSREIDSDKQ